MKLIISTFNIQNKYYIYKYSGLEGDIDYCQQISNFLKEYNIDILGVQELTKLYENRLLINLGKDYKVYGKYRFPIIANIFPLVKKFNEATKIITKYEVLKQETYHLPSFPNVPRILTEVLVNCNNKMIKIYNTHIDYLSEKIKIKQLNYIVKKIKTESTKAILMGDFNSTIKKEYFRDFIKSLEELGYKHILVNNSTHRSSKLAIDHIFIPVDWKVKNVFVVDFQTEVSDHKPVVVELVI